jgi:hypothetical protein
MTAIAQTPYNSNIKTIATPSISIEDLKNEACRAIPVLFQIVENRNTSKKLHDAFIKILSQKLNEGKLAIQLGLAQELQQLQKHTTTQNTSAVLQNITKAIFGYIGITTGYSQGNTFMIVGGLMALYSLVQSYLSGEKSLDQKIVSKIQAITPLILPLLGCLLTLTGFGSFALSDPTAAIDWLNTNCGYISTAASLGSSYYVWQEASEEQEIIATDGFIKEKEQSTITLARKMSFLFNENTESNNALIKSFTNIINKLIKIVMGR